MVFAAVGSAAGARVPGACEEVAVSAPVWNRTLIKGFTKVHGCSGLNLVSSLGL